jgi:hypothetical protein
MTTKFTELVGCEQPIQLAGMGPICSDELCAAVSEAGGLGMITVAATSPEGLERRLDHIRSLTTRPIGTNFLIPVTDPECLRVASPTARVVDFFWGDPDPELVQLAHSGGARWRAGRWVRQPRQWPPNAPGATSSSPRVLKRADPFAEPLDFCHCSLTCWIRSRFRCWRRVASVVLARSRRSFRPARPVRDAARGSPRRGSRRRIQSTLRRSFALTPKTPSARTCTT